MIEILEMGYSIAICLCLYRLLASKYNEREYGKPLSRPVLILDRAATQVIFVVRSEDRSMVISTENLRSFKCAKFLHNSSTVSSPAEIASDCDDRTCVDKQSKRGIESQLARLWSLSLLGTGGLRAAHGLRIDHLMSSTMQIRKPPFS